MNIATLNAFRKANFTDEQTEAIIDFVQSEIKNRDNNIATKADLNDLNLRIESKILEAKVEMMKWMVGVALIVTGIGLGGVYFMLEHVR